MSVADFETDFKRLGRKWQYYILAMQNIAFALDNLMLDQPTSPEIVDALIKGTLLPMLKEGSNSEVAFLADQNGIISFAISDDKSSIINRRLLFTSPAGQSLQEHGKPLVVYRKKGFDLAPELDALNVDSVMIFRLDMPWAYQFLGVCNGQDQPEPYLSEDTQFLAPLMKTLFSGIFLVQKVADAKMIATKAQADADRDRIIAETQKESTRQEKADQYGWARLQGEWSYLAKASEDFFMAQLGKWKWES